MPPAKLMNCSKIFGKFSKNKLLLISFSDLLESFIEVYNYIIKNHRYPTIVIFKLIYHSLITN